MAVVIWPDLIEKIAKATRLDLRHTIPLSMQRNIYYLDDLKIRTVLIYVVRYIIFLKIIFYLKSYK